MRAAFPSIQYYPTRDSQRLISRVWEQADAPADVIYLHGIVSHGGWYQASCSHLAQKGFQVHFLDRRGSGLNADGRGDVGHWETWISDVEDYIRQIPGTRPRILLGISWGGILATAFVRRHPDAISGLGLICPGLFSYKAANPIQRSLLRVAATLGLKNLRINVPLQDPALFTNSAASQRYIAHDPFTLRKITVRFAIENLRLLNEAVNESTPVLTPTLLVLAGKDPIADNASTREFVGRMGCKKNRVVEYRDASHTLEFEDDPSQYFCDLANWCKNIAES